MGLFDFQEEKKNAICFYADNQEEIDRLRYFFNNRYTLDVLKKYLGDIFPYLEGVSVVQNGHTVPRERFFPLGKKSSAYRKDECTKLLALVHSHKSNLEYVLAQLPQYVSRAVLAMLSFGFAGKDSLIIFDAAKALVEEENRLYYYYSEPKKAKYMGIYGTVNSISRTQYLEKYLYLPDALRNIYTQVLMPNVSLQAMSSDEPQQGLTVCCAENEFISSFPVITGMYSQGTISCSGMKMGTAAATKVMKSVSIREIIPEDIRKKYKINLGQYFIPSLLQVLNKRKTGNVENYVKEAFSLVASN
ncbi:MAG: hypothetical protein ACI3ZN_11070, partial [Candidatus Cryptobacteroides sp.]